jgi:hypothetical protein
MEETPLLIHFSFDLPGSISVQLIEMAAKWQIAFFPAPGPLTRVTSRKGSEFYLIMDFVL